MRHRSTGIWTPLQEDFSEEEARPPNVNDTREQWCPWIQGDLIIPRSPLSTSRVPTWKTCFLTRMIQWWYLLSLQGERCTKFWSTRGAWPMWCSGNVHQLVVIPWSVEAIRRLFDWFRERLGRSTKVSWAEYDLLWEKRGQDIYHQVHCCKRVFCLQFSFGATFPE